MGQQFLLKVKFCPPYVLMQYQPLSNVFPHYKLESLHFAKMVQNGLLCTFFCFSPTLFLSPPLAFPSLSPSSVSFHFALYQFLSLLFKLSITYKGSTLPRQLIFIYQFINTIKKRSVFLTNQLLLLLVHKVLWGFVQIAVGAKDSQGCIF